SSFCCYASGHPRDLHSFPTRRSSDLLLVGDLDHVLLRRIGAGPDVGDVFGEGRHALALQLVVVLGEVSILLRVTRIVPAIAAERSEEHTSELQSRENLVCRLLLEKKK